MKTLRIFAIIAIVIGSLTIIGSLAETYAEDEVYGFFGGIFYLSYGILTINFLDKLKK